MRVKLTPSQMSELIGQPGFRDNFLIDYTAFLQHFNQRGADGLANSAEVSLLSCICLGLIAIATNTRISTVKTDSACDT